MNNKYKNISFFILFFYIIGLSYFQSFSQHWSIYFDMDVWVMYNSSLIASGYEQEFRDHPGFTLFFINALVFKIFSLINSNFVFNIDNIIISNNSNEILGNLFILLRFINSLFFIFTLLFLYKILRIFDINRLQSFLALSIISCSQTFYQNLFQLRTEILSLLTFLMSFYFLLIFFKRRKNLINLILAGIFFSFSMLTSIKIIFLFGFVFLLMPITSRLFEIKNNDLIFLNKDKIFFYCFIFYAILIFFYIYLELFYINKHPRFVSIDNIDLKIFTFFNLLYLLYLFVISKFQLKEFKNFFCIFSFYLGGFILGIFFFLFLDFLKLTEMSYPIIVRLTNPFYYMSINSYTETPLGFKYLIEMLIILFNNFTFSKILFISLFFILIFSIWIDAKKKNNKLLSFKIILFFSIFFNILIFNIRYFLVYDIVIYPFYLILLLICLKNYSNKNANLFLCLIFLFSFSTILETNPHYELNKSKNTFIGLYDPKNYDPKNSQNTWNGFKSYFNRQKELSKICNSNHLVGNEYFVPKLNSNFFNKLCYIYKN